MADKKARGSIPPPPPPPTTSPSSKILHTPNGKMESQTTAASSSALTNGLTEGTSNVSHKSDNNSSNKPKPSSKPSKLTRAFSSGSMTLPSFNKLGKGRKSSKSKILSDTDMQESNIDNGIDSPKTTNKSEVVGGGGGPGGITNGETDEKSPWKLPGIGTMPKLQQRRSVPSMREKPTLLPKPNILAEHDDRDTPSQPSQSGSLLTSDHIVRELPPLPEMILNNNPNSAGRELPPVPISLSLGDEVINDIIAASNNDGDNNVENEVIQTATNKEVACNVNESSPSISTPERERNIDRRFSPLPKTPPDSSQDNGYRPLPKSPLQSDEEEEEEEEDEIHHSSTSSDVSSYSLHHESSENVASPTTNSKEEVVGVIDSSQTGVNSNFAPLGGEQQETSLVAEYQNSNFNLTPPGDDGGGGNLPGGKGETAEGDIRDYTIREIVTRYSYALPVRVRVLQGYCSDTSEVNISTDDVYNIHTIRHTKMLKVKDEDGMMHRISLEVPIKIGLIYNPSQDDDVSLNGYKFKTISDVTAMPILPKVISATQAVASSDDKNSVSEGEIFFVRHIHRSVFKGKKGLKVFSLLTKSNKVLFDDCAGKFTTKPSLVRMALSELLDRLGEVIFISRAVIYPTTDEASSSEFPGTLSRVVTLIECNTKTSLVASDVSYLDDDALEEANLIPVPKESLASFDLPLEDDIENLEVAVLKWTYPDYEDEDLHHVYDDTMAVSEELGLSNVSNISNALNIASSLSVPDVEDDHTYINLQQQQQQVDALSSENLAEKEKIFIEEDEEAGYDTVGIHLLRDDDMSQQSGHSSNEDLKRAEQPAASNHEYSSVFIHRSESAKRAAKPKLLPRSPNLGYSTVSQQHRTIDSAVEEGEGGGDGGDGGDGGGDGDGDGDVGKSRNSQTERGRLSGDKLQNQSSGTKVAAAESSSDITRMQTMLEMLTMKMTSVDSQLSSLAAAPSPAVTSDAKPVKPVKPPGSVVVEKEEEPEVVKSTTETNREYLSSLSAEQVSDLMEAMSLGQYKQIILDEHISGEILLECDEAVLREEIGITSKIHCIRLMKIITGQHSARAVLDKDK